MVGLSVECGLIELQAALKIMEASRLDSDNSVFFYEVVFFLQNSQTK